MADRATKPEQTDAQRAAAAQDDEVYSALGALLGTLEVVASDDAHPLAAVQRDRLRSALRLGHILGQQLDALLLLAAEDMAARLRPGHRALRPLVEHALRGALRSFEREGITLSLPEPGACADARVYVDSSRLDRMLSALAETLVACVGPGSSIAVTLTRGEREVSLSLIGLAAQRREAPKQPSTLLIERAARRLLELHGGALRFELEHATIQLTLPLAEAP